MKTPSCKRIQTGASRQMAFTLIELLVVITVIMVLAALIFPTVTSIKQNATRRKVKAELQQIAVAIQAYKGKYGCYPPDNPCSPMTNQLYFELLGVRLSGNVFETLDGTAKIADTDFPNAFGKTNNNAACVQGFMNITRGSADDSPIATSFLKALKPNDSGEIRQNVRVLTTSVRSAGDVINPFRYNSSSPTNNPNSYDLWVDVLIGDKINRISNWSEKAQIAN